MKVNEKPKGLSDHRVEEIRLWTPHDNQRRLIQNKSRFKVIRCGRRFGKTTYAINLLIKSALNTKDGKFFYIAPTYRQAKMIAWDMMIHTTDKFGPFHKNFIKKANESELFVSFHNGARIDIKGADNPDSLRGVGLDGVVLDEYAFMKPNVFSEIVSPALLEKQGFCVFISTPNGFNHFYDLYMEAQDRKDWATFHFTSYDNTLLTPEARAELDEKANTTNIDTFAQEYMAEFRKKQGLVYKDFIREKHVYETKQYERVETIAGVDFGFTNPACILTIDRDTEYNYYVKDEWYKARKSTDDIIDYAKNTGAQIFYPDPAEPDRIEQMTRAGLNCRDVSKSVGTGIARVSDLFKQNKIFIHKSCKNLIQELETYSYKEQRDDVIDKNQDEKPEKANDHAVDALRYALYMHAPVSHTEMHQDFGLYNYNYK